MITRSVRAADHPQHTALDIAHRQYRFPGFHQLETNHRLTRKWVRNVLVQHRTTSRRNARSKGQCDRLVRPVFAIRLRYRYPAADVHYLFQAPYVRLRPKYQREQGLPFHRLRSLRVPARRNQPFLRKYPEVLRLHRAVLHIHQLYRVAVIAQRELVTLHARKQRRKRYPHFRSRLQRPVFNV